MSASVADTNSELCVFLAMIAFYCINFYFPCCRLYSNEDARDKIIRILHVTFAGDEIIDDVPYNRGVSETEWLLSQMVYAILIQHWRNLNVWCLHQRYAMISFGLERPTFDHCMDGQRQRGKWLYLIN